MTEGFAMRGLEAIEARLGCMQEERLVLAAANGVEEGLQAICEEAKALCPRDTGKLASSIAVRMTGNGGEVVASAPHAVRVEMGSAHTPARPFLYPAMRERQGEMMRRVGASLGEHVRRE